MRGVAHVVNKRKENFDIYIGRGSKWGNPYHIGRDGTREEVIQKYRKYLWGLIKSGNLTKEDFLELEGKRLGCFCKPLPCHGDVIVKAMVWILQEKE